MGCASQKVNGVETPLSAADAATLGCRPDDAIDKSFVADNGDPATFQHDGREYLARTPKTFTNLNTAWWDVSQLYGCSDRSRTRVKRGPKDRARLLTTVDCRTAEGDRQGYLPLLSNSDPKLPDWAGQEAAAFPDNWTIGMSFYHKVFTREHNQFVDEFRQRGAQAPDADCGLRHPSAPAKVIRNHDVTPDELEWTPQLLYDEPLFKGMNGNWNGLLKKESVASDPLAKAVGRLRSSDTATRTNEPYSVLASGPGMVGLGSEKPG